MSYINKNNVIHVCNNTSCITVSLSFFIPQTNRITMHKHQLKLSISSWKACMQYLILAQNVFHSFNTRDFLMKNPVDTFFLPTLSASRDRKPKWERKSRAVWNSCEGGGGLQSVCGSGKRLDFQISSLCRSKAFSYSICLVIRIRSLSCWTSSCKEEVNRGEWGVNRLWVISGRPLYKFSMHPQRGSPTV